MLLDLRTKFSTKFLKYKIVYTQYMYFLFVYYCNNTAVLVDLPAGHVSSIY